jgi:hypothetical protein
VRKLNPWAWRRKDMDENGRAKKEREIKREIGRERER